MRCLNITDIDYLWGFLDLVWQQEIGDNVKEDLRFFRKFWIQKERVTHRINLLTWSSMRLNDFTLQSNNNFWNTICIPFQWCGFNLKTYKILENTTILRLFREINCLTFRPNKYTIKLYSFQEHIVEQAKLRAPEKLTSSKKQFYHMSLSSSTNTMFSISMLILISMNSWPRRTA